MLAFQRVSRFKSIKYLILGVLKYDVKNEVEELLNKDIRVEFLGWKSSEELMILLCAADVYVQPGSQSATLQNSICCRCAVIVKDVKSHHPFVQGNGWEINTVSELEKAFSEAAIIDSQGELEEMCAHSLRIAKELLDYNKMAKRLAR